MAVRKRKSGAVDVDTDDSAAASSSAKAPEPLELDGEEVDGDQVDDGMSDFGSEAGSWSPRKKLMQMRTGPTVLEMQSFMSSKFTLLTWAVLCMTCGLALVLAVRDLFLPRLFFPAIPGDRVLRSFLFQAQDRLANDTTHEEGPINIDVELIIRFFGLLQLAFVGSKIVSFLTNAKEMLLLLGAVNLVIVAAIATVATESMQLSLNGKAGERAYEEDEYDTYITNERKWKNTSTFIDYASYALTFESVALMGTALEMYRLYTEPRVGEMSA